MLMFASKFVREGEVAHKRPHIVLQMTVKTKTTQRGDGPSGAPQTQQLNTREPTNQSGTGEQTGEGRKRDKTKL